MTKKLLIFGFGYCAEALISKLSNKDWEINVVSRNAEKITNLKKKGILACQWSDRKNVESYAINANSILLCVPPAGFGDPVKEEFSEFFSNLSKKSKLIYLSSTGVYGDHNGNWVDEEANLNPTTDLGLWRLNAEKSWKKFSKDLGLTLIVLRLSGIYGPGRSAIDRLKKGNAILVNQPKHFFSRIHIDDIVELIRLSIERDEISGTYNVCDNRPASSEQIMKEACRLLKLDCPKALPIDKLNLSKTALGFYSESKRVCNKKVLEDFRYQMIHPDYFSGLKSIVKKIKTP